MKRYITLINLFLFALLPSCSHTLHILSTIGSELGFSSKSNSEMARVEHKVFKEKESCFQLTSELIKEDFIHPSNRLFQFASNKTDNPYTKDQKEKIFKNVELLIYSDYQSVVVDILKSPSSEIDLSRDSYLSILKDSSHDEDLKKHLKSFSYLQSRNGDIDISSLKKINEFYSHVGLRSEDRIFQRGKWVYPPSLYNLSEKYRAIIKEKDPSLDRKIKNTSPYDAEKQSEVNLEIITFLLKYELERFNKNLSKISPINRKSKFDKFNELASYLYLSLSEITPFSSANHITLKDFIFRHVYLKNGVPVPRFLLKEGETVTALELQKMLRDGQKNTEHLYNAFAVRLEKKYLF